ncbi:MAG TPA: class I fructose-bisphosphate aldolase [Candidatus Nanoarchaeia archaeon]|nr:class I fructose-bisphosphate aldolase [Candidatus Nanoarchaeia archaeon]
MSVIEVDETRLSETVSEILRIGILAADESHGSPQRPKTIERRLASFGIPNDEVHVDAWRKLVRETPLLGDYVSGIILEGSRVLTDASIYAERGIVPGVKVDKGNTTLTVGPHQEPLTVGLDGLHSTVEVFRDYGARFTKWRTTTSISDILPTDQAIRENMGTHGESGYIVQSVGLVPILEPEVEIKGNHSLETSYTVTSRVLKAWAEQVQKQGVYLPGAILKTSFVIYGDKFTGQRSYAEVAKATLRCLMENVPKEVGGVVFLSGGQSDLEAMNHLNELQNLRMGQHPTPWPVTFSYSRALQNDAMEIWGGMPANVERAQQALLERASAALMATQGVLPAGYEFQFVPSRKAH